MSKEKAAKLAADKALSSGKANEVINKASNNSVVNKVKDFLLPSDKAIDAYLYIGTKKYEVQSFETEFQQEIDHKEQPQNEVKGGLLSFTLTQTADEVLNRWMFQRNIYYDGFMVFAPISRTASAPLKIIFKEARCISFEKIVGNNMGIQLRILVSAKHINVNGIGHKNDIRYIPKED